MYHFLLPGCFWSPKAPGLLLELPRAPPGPPRNAIWGLALGSFDLFHRIRMIIVAQIYRFPIFPDRFFIEYSKPYLHFLFWDLDLKYVVLLNTVYGPNLDL